MTLLQSLLRNRGLGTMLWLARETLNMEEMYVGLCVIALMGASFTFLLQYLEGRLVGWQADRPA